MADMGRDGALKALIQGRCDMSLVSARIKELPSLICPYGRLNPQRVIQDLVERIDLVSFIDEHVPLKNKDTVSSLVAHSTMKKPFFNVNSKKQFIIVLGGLEEILLVLLCNICISILWILFPSSCTRGVTLPQNDTMRPLKTSPFSFRKINQFYQHHLRTSGHAANEYLAQRGLTKDIIERYQ